MTNLQILAERLLRMLPPDGSQIPHEDARILLGREVQHAVPTDTYFDIIELLEQRGNVLRARGRGGAVKLAQPVSPRLERSETPLLEAQLMPSLQRYLEMRFWRRLNLRDDAHWKVVDTSTGGAQNGQWRRCDFLAFSIVPRRVLPGAELELFSFELKAHAAGNIAAVHEAKAQTRGTHFGYLVWHIPDALKMKPRLNDVHHECQRAGVGLITFADPQNLDSWIFQLAAAKQSTDSAKIDEFLGTRLSVTETAAIKRKLKA